MLKLPPLDTPRWTWLPQVRRTEYYLWHLHRMEEERYWQIAWSEYKKRRLLAEKNYRSSAQDQPMWMSIGRELYASFLDPELFIEAYYASRMKQGITKAPDLADIKGAIKTLGLWFDESFQPDAEGDVIIAGGQLDSLCIRFPGTNAAYWLEQKPDEFPAYFHLLYRPLGEVDAALVTKAGHELRAVSVIRALDRTGIWPLDLHERLAVLRTQTLNKKR